MDNTWWICSTDDEFTQRAHERAERLRPLILPDGQREYSEFMTQALALERDDQRHRPRIPRE